MSSLHPNAPQCHHVRTNGLRCGSPALRRQNLCYYHHKAKNSPSWVRAELPLLEDGNAIQLGIAQVMRMLMSGAIEYRAAQLMVDSFRLSIRNLKNMKVEPYAPNVITVDPHYDAANAGSVKFPLTSSQQEELTAHGAFAEDTTQGIDQDSIQDTNQVVSSSTRMDTASEPRSGETGLAQAVRPGWKGRDDSSPVGTAPQQAGESPSSPSAVDKVGIDPPETCNLQPCNVPSIPNKPFDQMTEQEQEAFIMRACKNDAYFMKEEDMPPPKKSDYQTLAELLSAELKDVG